MKHGLWQWTILLVVLCLLLGGCAGQAKETDAEPVSPYTYGKSLKKWTFQGENTCFDVGTAAGSGWSLPDGTPEKIIGGKSSTFYDYRVEVGLRYDSGTDGGRVRLLHRARETTFYGKFFYAVEIENADTLRLIKCVASQEKELACVALPSSLADGQTHTVAVDAVDEWLIVFLDGQELLRQSDSSGDSVLYGKYGFSAENVSLWIGELTVTEIEDSLGGTADNQLGGKFNEAVNGGE